MKTKGDKKIQFTSVSVPTTLFRKVEKKIENTGFPSVSSYVAFILRMVISEGSKKKTDYDAELIKRRLRELGYM